MPYFQTTDGIFLEVQLNLFYKYFINNERRIIN